jgi:hypothetical protein
MNRHITFDAALTKSTTETRGDVRLLALWPFIVVVAILAMIAVITDGPSTPDQRIQVFEGTYP